jgi:hypothetical protein
MLFNKLKQAALGEREPPHMGNRKRPFYYHLLGQLPGKGATECVSDSWFVKALTMRFAYVDNYLAMGLSGEY